MNMYLYMMGLRRDATPVMEPAGGLDSEQVG